MRPVNSSHSVTSFSTAVMTLTGSGPCCCGGGVFLQPAKAKTSQRQADECGGPEAGDVGDHAEELDVRLATLPN